MNNQLATVKYKFCLFLLFTAWYFLWYVIPNFFPIFTPVYLSMGILDRKLPYAPWTFLIYLSDYLLALLVIHSFRTCEELHSFGRLAFTVLTLCGICYILYPTVYPREMYLTEPTSAFVQWMVKLVRTADSPTNCLPSMHVAITSVCVYSMRSRGPKIYGIYWVWGWLIFLSTLTTKQHYAIDIVGGIAVATIAVFLERRWERAVLVRERVQRTFLPILNRINR